MDDTSPTATDGVTLGAGATITVGAGDVVGRDKIVHNIQNIYQRALTAAEQAAQARLLETQILAQGVSAFVERLQARVSQSPDLESGNPYKGLLEYRLGDSAIFFGRRGASKAFIASLRQSPLTVLHAESGAGKTSLLQAGVAPRLIIGGHLPVHLRPYNIGPSLAVKRAFLSDFGQTPKLASLPLRDFLREACGVLGADTTLYIFLDQFEEFFIHLDQAARAEFVGELAECLDDDSLNVRWALSLRTEYFGSLANFRPRIRNPFENDFRLNRLNRDEAREVVAEPASLRGIRFEDGLVDSLLADLSQETVQPPQIQLVCSALYESLKPGETAITRALYDGEGGAAGILRDHLSRVLNRDLPPGQRPVAQRVLEALTTSDLRRVIRTRNELAAELTPRGVPPLDLNAVLLQLVDSRLLRVQDASTGDTSTAGLAYELAHDYLLDEIKLDPAVQARKAAQELLDQELHAHKRYGTLLSDDKLAVIEARRGDLAIGEEAKVFIRKSEQALNRRRQVALGGIGLVIVLIVVGLLSIASALSAGQQRQNAEALQQTAEAAAARALTQESEALNAAAIAQAQEAVSEAGRAEALAEAQAAQDLQATSEAAAEAIAREEIANQSLRLAFRKTGIVPVGHRPNALAFDGTRLWVSNANDATLQAIDPLTGIAASPIAVDFGVTALAFDGERLWLANAELNIVQSVDPATGELGQPFQVGAYPAALAFDSVHSQLWVINRDDDTVQSIDLASGQVSEPLAVGDSPIAIIFDGARLWVANSGDGAVQAIDPATYNVGAAVSIGEFSGALATDGAQLWVARQFGDAVDTIDPATGAVLASVAVGGYPSALLFDGTLLWVVNERDNTVQAIDPYTGEKGTPIAVGKEDHALMFDGARLWAANVDDTVQAVDSALGLIGPPIAVGAGPAALAFDGALLWVANESDNTVQSVDPASGAVGEPIPVGNHPGALALDGAHLWVANSDDNTVQAIDLATGAIGDPIQVGARPSALLFDGARLWVANWAEDTVQAVAVSSGETGPPITVGRGPSALAFDGNKLWVANANDGTIQAVDPLGNIADAPIAVGKNPVALAFDGARLWVANYDDNTVQAVDPATGVAGPPVEVGHFVETLAFAGTRLWAGYYDIGAVQPIDIFASPITPESGPLLALGANVLLFDGARLWVADQNGAVKYIVVHR